MAIELNVLCIFMEAKVGGNPNGTHITCMYVSGKLSFDPSMKESQRKRIYNQLFKNLLVLNWCLIYQNKSGNSANRIISMITSVSFHITWLLLQYLTNLKTDARNHLSKYHKRKKNYTILTGINLSLYGSQISGSIPFNIPQNLGRWGAIVGVCATSLA